MKTYQPPEILWQNVDLADVLTESPLSQLFIDGEGKDNPNTIKWW